jgi:hypothetical protein
MTKLRSSHTSKGGFDVDCNVCGKKIEDGDTMYELNKGTWSEDKPREGAGDTGDAEFVHEEVKGNYHETCLPADLPVEED